MKARLLWLLRLCPSCRQPLGRRRTGAAGFPYRKCGNRRCDTIAVGSRLPW